MTYSLKELLNFQLVYLSIDLEEKYMLNFFFTSK